MRENRMYKAIIDEINSKVQMLKKGLDAEFLIMQTLASQLPAIKGRLVENGEEIEDKYYSAVRKSQAIRLKINSLLGQLPSPKGEGL
jgi:hypothetical protein